MKCRQCKEPETFVEGVCVLCNRCSLCCGCGIIDGDNPVLRKYELWMHRVRMKSREAEYQIQKRDFRGAYKSLVQLGKFVESVKYFVRRKK